jgi:hypothetical protein
MSTALNVGQKVNSVDTTNKLPLACDGLLTLFQADRLPTLGYASLAFPCDSLGGEHCAVDYGGQSLG